MGSSISWIAVKGRAVEDLQRTLGLKPTGKLGHYGQHPVVGRQLSDGWYILIASDSDDRITKYKTLTQVAKGCEVVACTVEEHVMSSSGAFWRKGKKVWSVKHDGEKGALNLAKAGKLPESYSALEKETLETQRMEGDGADVDHVFELPLKLAKQLVGFKHDEELVGVAEGSYEIYDFDIRQKVSRIVNGAWFQLIFYLLVPFAVFLVLVIFAAPHLLRLLHKLIEWAATP
jgi:hypothetical protein